MQTLILGDCFDYMADMPSGSVDVILTDPPYNLSGYSTGNMDFSWRKTINNNIATWDKDFDPILLLEPFQRILRENGTIFAFTSYNLLGKWHQAFDPEFDTFQFFVWHKTNPPIKIRRAGFLNSCELIVCIWNQGHHWNFGKQNEMHNFFQSGICQGKERIGHPTQKPLSILNQLMKYVVKPGAVVFDPYMGVGSSGEAALLAGCDFIGVEIDPLYYALAKDRLAKYLDNEIQNVVS